MLREERRFLAMHKLGQKSPLLELPDGRIPFGETIEEALIRELLEETGLSVSPTILLTTWNYMKKQVMFRLLVSSIRLLLKSCPCYGVLRNMILILGCLLVSWTSWCLMLRLVYQELLSCSKAALRVSLPQT